MPILTIEDNSVRQHCALCERVRDVPLERLALREDLPPDVLPLPPCACGAVEHLFHSPPDEPEHPEAGSFGHRHRLLVDGLIDALHETTIDSGSLASRVTQFVPSSAREQWFPNGLRIDVDEREARP